MFKDHFSKQSQLYSRYRPLYPEELFSFLATLTTAHDLAWDSGTGNGQAAIALSKHYALVYATDPSSEQLKNRLPGERIEFRIERAETCSLPDQSVDIATVANALHWYDWNLFYNEVNRVVKPGGILAVWSYALPVIHPEIDQLVAYLHNDILNDYWLEENRLVEHGYRDIPFPFEEITCPALYSKRTMTLEDILGYLHTWSAVQRYIEANNKNPIDQIREELDRLNTSGGKAFDVHWKLLLRVGRIKTS